MRLNQLLANCHTHFKIENEKDQEVFGISTYSKEIKQNYIFSVVKGQRYNGANFINELKDITNIVLILDKNIVLSDYTSNKIQERFVKIYTKNVVLLSGEIASLLYKNNIPNINCFIRIRSVSRSIPSTSSAKPPTRCKALLIPKPCLIISPASIKITTS